MDGEAHDARAPRGHATPRAGGHQPVLPDDLVRLAAVVPGDTVVDGTFGAGGHASLLVAQLQGRGRCICVDRDPAVRARFDAVSATWPTAVDARFCHATFPDAFNSLVREGASADVLILDVGVSSMQIDEPERGFSYVHDAPLDMRMDPGSGQTARDLLAALDAGELERLLRDLGEEPHARAIARSIVRRREHDPIEHTGQLVDAVRAAVPIHRARRGGHPAKRVFQALRIAVNDELGMLDAGLDAAFALLGCGGRMAVITFHSLEDRMVKRRFEAWRGRCTCPPGLPVCGCGVRTQVELLTRGAVKASDREIAANPRAASARLRAVRKLGGAAS